MLASTLFTIELNDKTQRNGFHKRRENMKGKEISLGFFNVFFILSVNVDFIYKTQNNSLFHENN